MATTAIDWVLSKRLGAQVTSPKPNETPSKTTGPNGVAGLKQTLPSAMDLVAGCLGRLTLETGCPMRAYVCDPD